MDILDRRKKAYMIVIILLYMSPLALAAEGDAPAGGDASMLIGDPIVAFTKLPQATQDMIKLIIGLVALAAIILGIIALLASHMKTSAGAAVGSAGMRNEGAHSMITVVGVAILLIVAIGVFWFFMTTGL